MREKRISDLTISLAVIQATVATFSLAALAIFVVGWGIGVERVNVLQDFLSAFSGVIFFLVKIFIFILIFIFLVMFVCWLRKDEEGMTILPFDVATGENGYSGKAISDLLTAELRRIKRIHEVEAKKILPMGLELETSTSSSVVPKSKAPTSSLITSGSKTLTLPRVVPRSENLAYKVAEAGAVQVGPAWVLIGPLLASLKQLWPGSDSEQVITGSLQKYGSVINLVAHLEHHEIRAWEVRHQIRPQDKIRDEQIPFMVRDLAFKIAKDLSSEQDGQAKTWQGLEHITDAWDSYYRYTLTEDESELEHAQESCLLAAKAEVGYKKSFDLLLDLGITYLNNKNYVVAEKLFRQAVDIKSDSNFFVGRGFAFANLKQFEEALKCFDKAIELDHKHVSAWYGKGITIQNLGMYEDALDCYEKAIELDRKNVLAWYSKGETLSYLGKYEDALDCYVKAIELDPQDPEAWYNKGFVLDILGRTEEAIEAHEKAIELDPQDPEAWYNKGVALDNLCRTEEAIEAHEKVIELNPKNTVAHIALARLYRKESERVEQCKLARDLIENESEYNRSCFEAICGSADDALALLRSALKKRQQTVDWARRDPDFEFIRDDPRFQALLDEFSTDEKDRLK